jgi:hypothetical protein
VIVLIQCECPKGHPIAGSPLEWPDGLMPAELQARAQDACLLMQAAMLGSMAKGTLAPACPACGAPHDQWTFALFEAKEGVTYADLVKSVAEASYLDVEVFELPGRKKK